MTKVQITGTLVYHIKKDEKHFFGIDDSTGVICCVLWLKDFNNQRGNAASSRQNDLRNWLVEEGIKVGDCISVLGALESFRDNIQINIHRIRVIRDNMEEVLQYQHMD